MFDKQAVNEYRQITAPEQLRRRVIDTAANPKPKAPVYWIPLVGSFAACLAILVVASTMWSGTTQADVSLSDNGILIASDLPVTAEITSRTTGTYYTDILIESDGKCVIESDGNFLTEDQDGVWVPLSSPYRHQDQITLRWCVNGPDDNTTLTVNGVDYMLTIDSELNVAVIHPIVQD